MPRAPREKRERYRPKIPINWEMVDKYLEAGATGVQVAAVLGMHPETFYNRCIMEKKVIFSEYRNRKLEKGNSQLLGKQFKMAMDGDRGMLIWLGKNRLGQTDRQKIDHTTNGKEIAPIFLPLKEDE
jgi:hypothetical protein